MSNKSIAKNTNTELITVDTSTSTILEKLDAEIKKLKHIEETPWKTTGNVTGFPVNIQKETLIPNLIRMGSVVKAKEEAYNKYAESDLNLSRYPSFEDNGATAEGITSDISLRIAIIEQKERMDKLKEYKDKMSKFLSEAEQKANLIKDMEKFLA